MAGIACVCGRRAAGGGLRRGPQLPPRERPVPPDGPGERVLMGLFNAKLEGALPGGQRPGRGFEASWKGFVEAAEAVAAKRPPVEQHRLIAGVLESIMPPFVPPFLRWAFRPSPFVCWVNALMPRSTKPMWLIDEYAMSFLKSRWASAHNAP